VVIHDQVVRKFVPEDIVQIEEEHLRLHSSLNILRSTCFNLDNQLSCPSCSRETLATCRGRLVSFFYNFVSISTNHFNHEEFLMLRRTLGGKEDNNFRAHQQAHNNILCELKAAISKCATLDVHGETAEAYRHLNRKITEQFEEHDRFFDGI
jgi:hypothetical protein